MDIYGQDIPLHILESMYFIFGHLDAETYVYLYNWGVKIGQQC